jgi:hypothetical protein
MLDSRGGVTELFHVLLSSCCRALTSSLVRGSKQNSRQSARPIRAPKYDPERGSSESLPWANKGLEVQHGGDHCPVVYRISTTVAIDVCQRCGANVFCFPVCHRRPPDFLAYPRLHHTPPKNAEIPRKSRGNPEGNIRKTRGNP